MVFCGLFPTDADQYEDLREALQKLKLNDAALSYEPETSTAMGLDLDNNCATLGVTASTASSVKNFACSAETSDLIPERILPAASSGSSPFGNQPKIDAPPRMMSKMTAKIVKIPRPSMKALNRICKLSRVGSMRLDKDIS